MSVLIGIKPETELGPPLPLLGLGTFKWWISGLMLKPLFFLISRLNNDCSPLAINLQIN